MHAKVEKSELWEVVGVGLSLEARTCKHRAGYRGIWKFEDSTLPSLLSWIARAFRLIPYRRHRTQALRFGFNVDRELELLA